MNVSRGYTTNGLNQYTAAGSASFCYDANGNLTADGASVYKYDVENRLVEKRAQGTGNTNCASLAYTGAIQAALRYDPLGRLHELGGSGGTVVARFLYDGDALVGEYNTSGTLLRRYVHGADAGADDPLVWFEGTGTAYTNARHLYADPRGSIVLVGNSSGAALATNTYDEYGIPGSSNAGRFQYTGQAWLAELGMYYFKARIYSPTLGRFLQTDPIGYEGGVNIYAYVGNDPVNGTDFSGMAEDDKEFRIPQLIGKVEGAYNDSSITIKVDNPIYSGEVTLSTSGVSGSVTSGSATVAGSADQSGATGSVAIRDLGSANVAVGRPVQAYESGSAADLRSRSVRGDDLEVHHAPQAHVAEQNSPGYSRTNGPAIALPTSEHREIPRVRGSITISPRSMLAGAARDLRIYTNATNKQIQKWLKAAKSYFGM